jgi:putative FmdB family regulatory protein
MPTYDYVCNACQQRFDIFLTYAEYGKKPVKCAHCHSADVKRRPPRVRVMKGDEARFADMADPAKLGALEDDPKALGKMMREMGSNLGEELPPEFGEVVDRLEKGQSPDEIEKAIPDLGAGSDLGGDE